MSGVGYQVPGDLALNADGTDLVLAYGPEATRQEIRNGSQVFLGAWEYNTASGIDYQGQVFVKGTDLTLIRATFSAWLLQRTNVEAITSMTLDLNRETRELTIRYTLALRGGQTLSDSLPFVLVQRRG